MNRTNNHVYVYHYLDVKCSDCDMSSEFAYELITNMYITMLCVHMLLTFYNIKKTVVVFVS